MPFGGGGAAASIGPSSTSPEALLEVVAEVEHLEALVLQYDDDSEGCTFSEIRRATSVCLAGIAMAAACRASYAAIGRSAGMSISIALGTCSSALALLLECWDSRRCVGEGLMSVADALLFAVERISAELERLMRSVDLCTQPPPNCNFDDPLDGPDPN